MYCSLTWLTLHIRVGISISHLSILGIVAYGRCYIFHCFYFFIPAVVLSCFRCSACILQMRMNLFLVLIEVSCFSGLSFCLYLKFLLLLLSLLFLLLLLLFSLSSSLLLRALFWLLLLVAVVLLFSIYQCF